MNGNTNKLLGTAARLVLPFSIGIVAAWHYPSLLLTEVCATLACLFALMALAFNKWNQCASLCTYLCAAAIGALLMNSSMNRLAWHETNEYDRYDAIIINRPERHGKIWRLDAMVTAINNKHASPFKIRISVLSPDSIFKYSIGNGIECVSVLEEPKPGNKPNFNYALYLKTRDIRATSFVYADNIRKKDIKASDIPFMCRMEIGMNNVREKIIEAFISGKTNASSHSKTTISQTEADDIALIAALTLGDKSMLTKNTKQEYSIAGASHILALSGLHLGIIYSLLLLVTWRRNRLRLWRLTVSLITITTIWGYVALVGMPISAVRSALMLSICAFVDLSERNKCHLNTILTAAAIILAVSPMSIFDLGFQMSFTAVMAIIFLSEPLYHYLFAWFSQDNRIIDAVCKLSATSIAAQIGVIPLTAYCFGRVSCWFLLSNLIMIPLATLLLYGGIAMIAVAKIGMLSAVVAKAMGYAALIMNQSAHFISTLPGASIEGIHLSPLQLTSIYVAMVTIIIVCHCIRVRRSILPFTMPYRNDEEQEH